jgi:hypothetical protein
MEKGHGSDRHERSTALLKRRDRPRRAYRPAGYWTITVLNLEALEDISALTGLLTPTVRAALG